MFHKIGAVMYAIWGVLHVKAAFHVFELGRTLEANMVQGRIFQDAWALLFFAAVSMVLACRNWKNSRVGYWLNLVVVTATDIGFILFVLVPGYLPLWPGSLGPIFWILGTAFTTLGICKEKTTP